MICDPLASRATDLTIGLAEEAGINVAAGVGAKTGCRPLGPPDAGVMEQGEELVTFYILMTHDLGAPALGDV